MNWTETTSETDPIDYPTAKAFLRLDDDGERALILDLISTARTYAERYTGRQWAASTITATYYPDEQAGRLALPRGPLAAISSVVDGNGYTLDPSTYGTRRDGTTDYLVWANGSPPAAWPVTVTYTAGAALPADVKTAMLLHIGSLYRNREATTDRQQYATAHGLDAVYGLCAQQSIG